MPLLATIRLAGLDDWEQQPAPRVPCPPSQHARAGAIETPGIHRGRPGVTPSPGGGKEAPRLGDRCMDFQAIPHHWDESMNPFRGEMMDCVAAVARQQGQGRTGQ